MKGSESLPAIKSIGSQDTSHSGAKPRAATPSARAHEDGLVPLVRIIARQAAREFAKQRSESSSTPALAPEEKRR